MRKIAGIIGFVALFLVMFSAPAQASTINGCNDNGVCLYDWTGYNYNSGFFQRSMADITATNDGGVAGCMNLNTKQWHDLNGSPNNTASSLYINANLPNGTVRWVTFRENLCGGGGSELVYRVEGSYLVAENNLAEATKDNACYNYTCPWNWFDRISSIKVHV